MNKTIPVGVKIPDGYEVVGDMPHSVTHDDDSLYVRFDIRPIAQGICQAEPNNNLQELIAQAEADREKYPFVWWLAWEYSFCDGFKTCKIEPQWSSKFEYRRHPHADHIMQVKQDKIDYPDFWKQLTQWTLSNADGWMEIDDIDCLGYRNGKYRPHPHRESIILFHACSDTDKKRWQVKAANNRVLDWATCTVPPSWNDDFEYRLRPRVCSITVGDKVYKFPEPVRELLEIGQEYFVANPFIAEVESVKITELFDWKKMFDAGLMHLEKQAAEQHLIAIKAVNMQVAL